LKETQPVVAVLSDFGVSRVSSVTVTKGQIGTLPFTPPEVFKGKEHTKSSDIYALGILMWILISKKTKTKDLYPNVINDAKVPEAVENGSRPPVTKDFPPNYADIMKQ
jgi:serine/threonine protein kinase